MATTLQSEIFERYKLPTGTRFLYVTHDMEGYTLAENVVVQSDPDYPSIANVYFHFHCPNCGDDHVMLERDGFTPLFSTVGWELRCGHVNVRMPWAKPSPKESASCLQ